MLNASFIVIMIVVALVVGGGFMAYLWRVKQRQLVVAGGIATLAGMRWREFSRFVIEALQAQGFEAHPDEHNPEQTDLRLTRGGQTWLLSCKQGPKTRVTGTQVGELTDAIRLNGAAGGILVTLGTIEPSARRLASNVEMLDGQTLWPLLDPLLPPSVHNGLREKAQAHVTRTAALGWVGALVVGFGMALLFAPKGDPSAAQIATAPSGASTQPARTTAAVAPSATPQGATPAPAIAPTVSIATMPEEDQRKQVIDEVSGLPGIDSVFWSTRSTLMVQLSEEASQQRIDEICAVVKHFDAVRTSRLHLQPPKGSDARVRFLQCATF